ncbi:hypothetical protein ACFYRY_22065 [Streptomyces sp. NPDC005263]|uniref:hypothetical protein n=1 Tax=Streptomyces sp. NPDC005263 TaxID=3364711 RepID=UPI0036CD4469
MKGATDEPQELEVTVKDAERQMSFRVNKPRVVVKFLQDETDDRKFREIERYTIFTRNEWVGRATAKPLHNHVTAPLRLATRLLPVAQRGEWLEEQRSYLADLSTPRKRWAWMLSQLIAMPKYAYTVRASREKEPA